MKKINYIRLVLVVIQLCFIKVVAAPAQKAGEVISIKSNFQTLLTRFKVYLDYYSMTGEVKQLYEESLQYEDEGEYEVALVLLEEAMALLTNPEQNEQNDHKINLSPSAGVPNNSPNLRIGVLTGVDYNRQEFEISTFESDSTVEEQFNKPYLGISTAYIINLSAISSLELYNAFRYDRENLRDDYRIRWQIGNFINVQYAGYWNQGKIEDSYSYWEHNLSANISDVIGSDLYWRFYDIYNYKTYQAGLFTIRDYYRNRFTALVEWRTDLLGITSFEYGNEKNETLSFEDNDYDQHHIRAGIRSDNMGRYSHNLFLDMSQRKYSLLLTDSLIMNSFEAYALEINYEVLILNQLLFIIEDNFLYKIYEQKSSIEPDYYWNLLRPGLRFRFSNGFDFGLGYEWEFKEHKNDPFDSYNVSEQNYRADGVFGEVNIFSSGGTYLTALVSYQWRRYPESLTNDLFSLYSNRNILSMMLMAYIPVSQHLNLNAFITYDNDLDIDFDQQNNQSTIFSIELEYIF
jgi:hypothetical protein